MPVKTPSPPAFSRRCTISPSRISFNAPAGSFVIRPTSQHPPSSGQGFEAALASSQYFILIASPAASQSRWVKREIDCWLRLHDGRPNNFLVVLSDGKLEWDDAANDFDWNATTALPKILDWNGAELSALSLSGRFSGVPLYVDVSELKRSGHLTLDNAPFLDATATLAATIDDRPKSDLIGAERGSPSSIPAYAEYRDRPVIRAAAPARRSLHLRQHTTTNGGGRDDTCAEASGRSFRRGGARLVRFGASARMAERDTGELRQCWPPCPRVRHSLVVAGDQRRRHRRPRSNRLVTRWHASSVGRR